MSVALTLTDADITNGLMTLIGTVTISGSYVTGGDTVDLTTLYGKQSVQGIGLDSTQAPRFATVDSHLGGYGTGATPGAGGYYEFVKGSALNNWKLQLFDSAGTERAAGAYPGGVTGDDVRFILVFRRPQ